MAVTTATAAPYAPASAIIDLIRRFRDRGLATPITAEVLGRAGVSASLITRTIQALQTLDLIDDKGAPTTTLNGLRLAPEAEFKARLAEWLNAAYADVLQFVDPATASDTQVRDAFRSYSPVGQQPRMVTLFQGLYAAAGIGPDADKKQPTPRPGARTAQAPAVRSAIHPKSDANGTANRKPPVIHNGASMPPALAGLLASVPFERGRWTREEREKFVNTFGTVLDYCLPVVEEAEEGADHG